MLLSWQSIHPLFAPSVSGPGRDVCLDELIEKLVGAGARGIALDIDFSSSSTPEGDEALTKALQRAGGSVILPSFEQLAKSGNGKKLFHDHPLPALLRHAWQLYNSERLSRT